jgi:hypothetical protein
MPRLKSEIWVAALLRRCQTEGHYGAVIHKGSAEAGAVYVYINHLDGTYDLLGPPPGPAHDESGERRFVTEFSSPCDWATASALVARRRKSDSDLWAVEIEDRHGLAGLLREKP